FTTRMSALSVGSGRFIAWIPPSGQDGFLMEAVPELRRLRLRGRPLEPPPVAPRPGERRLEVVEDVLHRRQLRRGGLRDAGDALARVEEAVLRVAVDGGREERVGDAEALPEVARAAEADALGQALDAGLLP